MKICPQCAFANEERFPICVVCNTVLVDVPSTPCADPASPEHEWQALNRMRHETLRRQCRSAASLYAVLVALSAVFPGLVLSPSILLLYLLSGVVVAVAVLRDLAGQFSASVLQGGLSVALILSFGPMQPFVIFMLAGQVVLAALFWHWTDLIQNAQR